MKILKYIIFSILCLFLIGFLSFNFLAIRSLPELSGSMNSKLVAKNVDIYTDNFGIPHIYAENEIDAFYALGKMMASHRLFQMDMMRRIASGKLSEIIGEKTIDIDKLTRSLRIRKTMEDFYMNNKRKMDPRMLILASSFLKGINDYIDGQPLPIEFFILRYKPEHFDLIDSMSISGYMALGFSEGLIGDTLFYDLTNEFGVDPVSELRIGEKKIPKNSKTTKVKTQVNTILKSLSKATTLINDHMFMFHGSNSWVLSAARSKSGKPLLANDPHIAFSNPSVWFEAHIDTPTYKMYGHFLPLIPFPVIGFNQNLAWAVTMSEVDDVDLYIEESKDKEISEVKYKGNWVKTIKEEEFIKIKGHKNGGIPLTVTRTPHGPLLNGTMLSHKEKPISLKWTYYHPENDTLKTLYVMNRATDCNTFKDGIQYSAAPGLNLSCVDSKNNIGWWVMGKIPKRNFSDSDILLDGASGKFEYDDYYKFSENPSSYNPDSGVIISTNFKPEDEKYKSIDGYWQPSDRADRLKELLENDKKFSLNDFKKIQNDNFTFESSNVLKVVLPIIEKSKNKSSRHLKAYTYLTDWNSVSDINSVGATVYHMLNFYIMKDLLYDELGEDRFVAFGKLADYWHFFKYVIKEPSSFWWDDKSTSVFESREDIILKAFDETLETLALRFGPRVSSWLWGLEHTVEFVHPIGKVKPFDLIFNLGPYAADSAHYHVNNLTVKRSENTFDVYLGPSTRRLIDMSDINNTLGILPTGESGQLKSDHFDDQVLMYLRGEYRKQYFDKDEIQKVSKKLTIIPSKE